MGKNTKAIKEFERHESENIFSKILRKLGIKKTPNPSPYSKDYFRFKTDQPKQGFDEEDLKIPSKEFDSPFDDPKEEAPEGGEAAEGEQEGGGEENNEQSANPEESNEDAGDEEAEAEKSQQSTGSGTTEEQGVETDEMPEEPVERSSRGRGGNLVPFKNIYAKGCEEIYYLEAEDVRKIENGTMIIMGVCSGPNGVPSNLAESGPRRLPRVPVRRSNFGACYTPPIRKSQTPPCPHGHHWYPPGSPNNMKVKRPYSSYPPGRFYSCNTNPSSNAQEKTSGGRRSKFDSRDDYSRDSRSKYDSREYSRDSRSNYDSRNDYSRESRSKFDSRPVANSRESREFTPQSKSSRSNNQEESEYEDDENEEDYEEEEVQESESEAEPPPQSRQSSSRKSRWA